MRSLGFGSDRKFEDNGYYIRNSLFPKLTSEMRMDNTDKQIPINISSTMNTDVQERTSRRISD